MKKDSKRPVVIDLFSGAGGLSLGFEQAGFDIVAAVEIDPIHAAVHKFNFPHCRVIPKTVTDLAGQEIEQIAGLERGSVDVVIGGAPCQGFSLMGQRALDDPRNALVREFVRIVKELSPSYFLFENVKGLTLGKQRFFLEEIIEAFNSCGYEIRLPWQVLNASSYGVPQSRERLFLLGTKKGFKLPKYPLPSTRQAGAGEDILDIPIGPTCRDAMDDIPNAERFEELLRDDSVVTSEWGAPSEYARELRCLEKKHWHFGYQRHWDSKILTSSIRTYHTEISRKRFEETQPGDVEPISRFFRLPGNGVSNTLRAGTDSARGAFTSPRPIHYRYPRCITVREMARLHGFPDWFRLHKTKWHGARQIGNAVPPPLARAIAKEIIDAIGIKPSVPKDVIELGELSLLSMDMSQAATYWGTPVVIGRRDKKSGAKKRKQTEIELQRLLLREERGFYG